MPAGSESRTCAASSSELLNVAAVADTGLVNFTNIAREGCVGPTMKGYDEIHIDTPLGRGLRAWRRRPKRRTSARTSSASWT